MGHRRVDLRVNTGVLNDGASRSLAATIHLPEAERLADGPPVLVCLPGGGYNRHYFNINEPGYSEAAHHVANGVIVIAIDHLGVGESEIPDGELASIPVVAEANHAALQEIRKRMEAGKLVEDMAPISPGAVIGEGQSMGGHIALVMQAQCNSFNGLAMLGSSVVCTRLRAPDPAHDICMLNTENLADALAGFADFDWHYAFHWNDVPEQFAGAETAARDGTGPLPYWQSATTPEAQSLMIPGAVAKEAASVEVPVLLAIGERDVCQDPLRELAAFTSCRDLSLFLGRKMGHMHNFAGTRETLWRRLSAFIAQISEETHCTRSAPD